MKSRILNNKKKESLDRKEFKEAIVHILDEIALRYCPDEYEEFLSLWLFS